MNPFDRARSLATPEARTSIDLVEAFFQKLEAMDFEAVGGFFAQDGQLLAEAHRLKGIPGAIIQGRYDVVTPPVTAWDLHRAWPEAKLIVVPDAGHSMTEPGIRSALIEETHRFLRA